ncbi:VanZ family protein [Flavobacterium sp. 3HN19-14]|uniref:VanZ family protein n=1 Tax=Flavobacterium sp. 3HN19-14 TaxID=3448133 RepID=UPI003EE1E1C8
MKLTENLSAHKKAFLWLALVWTSIVTIFCLINMNALPTVKVDNFDKFGHITFHFGMTVLWFLYYKFRRENTSRRSLIKAFLFSFIYGVSIELIQTFFTKSRTGDIFDEIANIIGSLMAISVMILIMKRNNAKTL